MNLWITKKIMLNIAACLLRIILILIYKWTIHFVGNVGNIPPYLGNDVYNLSFLFTLFTLDLSQKKWELTPFYALETSHFLYS